MALKGTIKWETRPEQASLPGHQRVKWGPPCDEAQQAPPCLNSHSKTVWCSSGRAGWCAGWQRRQQALAASAAAVAKAAWPAATSWGFRALHLAPTAPLRGQLLAMHSCLGMSSLFPCSIAHDILPEAAGLQPLQIRFSPCPRLLNRLRVTCQHGFCHLPSPHQMAQEAQSACAWLCTCSRAASCAGRIWTAR